MRADNLLPFHQEAIWQQGASNAAVTPSMEAIAFVAHRGCTAGCLLKAANFGSTRFMVVRRPFFRVGDKDCAGPVVNFL